jgi:hypothetical protein
MSKRYKPEPTKPKTSSVSLKESISEIYQGAIPEKISQTIKQRLLLILMEPAEGFKNVVSKFEIKDLIFDPSSSSFYKPFLMFGSNYTLLEVILVFGETKVKKFLKKKIENFKEGETNFPMSATLFYSIAKKKFDNISDLFLDYYSELSNNYKFEARELRIKNEEQKNEKERSEQLEKMRFKLRGLDNALPDNEEAVRVYVSRYFPYLLQKTKDGYVIPEIDYTYESIIISMHTDSKLEHLTRFDVIEDLVFEPKGNNHDQIDPSPFVLKDERLGAEIKFSLVHLILKFDYVTIIEYLKKLESINRKAVRDYSDAFRCLVLLKNFFPEPLNNLRDIFTK